MKKTYKIIGAALSLILLFTGVLVVGIRALENSPAVSEYSRDVFVDESLFVREEDKPVGQITWQEKHNVYEHLSEDGCGVKLFSDEQLASCKENRKNGTQGGLCYEELLYLISDCIRLYNTYDTVTVGDASPVHAYHGTYEELAPGCDLWMYKEVWNDLHTIILQRLFALDGGLLPATLTHAEQGKASVCVREEPATACALSFGDGCDGTECVYATFLEEVSPKAYREELQTALLAYAEERYSEIEHTLLVIRADGSYAQKSLAIYVYRPGRKAGTMVFPTRELLASQPDGKGCSSEHAVDACVLLTQRLMPDYDVTQPTVARGMEDYRLGIPAGMSYQSMVETFGIPQCGGWYYLPEESYAPSAYPKCGYLLAEYPTTDVDTITVQLDEQYNVMRTWVRTHHTGEHTDEHGGEHTDEHAGGHPCD